RPLGLVFCRYASGQRRGPLCREMIVGVAALDGNSSGAVRQSAPHWAGPTQGELRMNNLHETNAIRELTSVDQSVRELLAAELDQIAGGWPSFEEIRGAGERAKLVQLLQIRLIIEPDLGTGTSPA